MYISIDIGGTNTRAISFDDNGNIIRRIKLKTNPNEKKDNLNELLIFIDSEVDIKGLGISAPGPANYEEGVLLDLPNLPGWRGFNLLSFFKENTKIENILLGNDANLMALANHHYFKATKQDITQFFTISTGLGAGLVINNEIFQGSSGFAQEVAMAPLAWKNTIGKGLGPGSFELFVSGSGLEYRGKEYGKNAKEIIANPEAKTIIDEGIETLANAIAVSAAMINPSIMIFDGSVSRKNKWYIDKAIEISKERMYSEQFDSIKFKISELDDDAALLGAYYLVKNKKEK